MYLFNAILYHFKIIFIRWIELAKIDIYEKDSIERLVTTRWKLDNIWKTFEGSTNLEIYLEKLYNITNSKLKQLK